MSDLSVKGAFAAKDCFPVRRGAQKRPILIQSIYPFQLAPRAGENQERTVVSTTANVLQEFIKETFLFGQEITFAADDSFLDMGIIDSTGVLELVMFLESNFGISVADDELVPENLDSINNIVRFVNGKCPPSPAVPLDGQLATDNPAASPA